VNMTGPSRQRERPEARPPAIPTCIMAALRNLLSPCVQPSLSHTVPLRSVTLLTLTTYRLQLCYNIYDCRSIAIPTTPRTHTHLEEWPLSVVSAPGCLAFCTKYYSGEGIRAVCYYCYLYTRLERRIGCAT